MSDLPFLDRLGAALEEAITPEPPRRRNWGPVAAAAGFVVVLGAGALWWLVGAGSQDPRPDPVATTAATTTTTTGVTAPELPTEWGRVAGLESLAGGAFATLNSVVATADGFVAAGTVSAGGALDRSLVLRSADGVDWVELPGAGLEGAFVNDVAVGPAGGLVAVGGSVDEAPRSRFWTFDGASWVAAEVETSAPAGQANVVITTGEGFVAAGVAFADAELDGDQLPAVWFSADGAAWEERSPESFGAPNEADISALAESDGRVIAGGLLSTVEGRSEAAVWVTDDLDDWRFVALPTDTEGFAGVAGLARGGPGLVAVGFEQRTGTAGAMWTSEDGTAWRRVPHDAGLFGGDDQSHTRIQSVAAVPGGLVAVGSRLVGPDARKVIWTSADGITWGRADVAGPPLLDGATLAHDVAASAGVVVVVGAELSIGADVAVPAAWSAPPPEGVVADAPITAASAPPPPEDDDVRASVEPVRATPGTRVLVDIDGPPGQDSVVWLVGADGEATEACTAIARGGRQRWCRFRPADVGVTTAGIYDVGIDSPERPVAGATLELVAPGTRLVALDGVYTPFLGPLVQQLSVRNDGDQPLDLAGWAIQAPRIATQRFEFSPGTDLAAGEVAIVFQGGPGGGVYPPDEARFFYTCNHFEGGVGGTSYWTGGAVLVDPAGEVLAEWAPPR